MGGANAPTTHTHQYIWRNGDNNTTGKWSVPAKDNASGSPVFAENLYDYYGMDVFLP